MPRCHRHNFGGGFQKRQLLSLLFEHNQPHVSKLIRSCPEWLWLCNDQLITKSIVPCCGEFSLASDCQSGRVNNATPHKSLAHNSATVMALEHIAICFLFSFMCYFLWMKYSPWISLCEYCIIYQSPMCIYTQLLSDLCSCDAYCQWIIENSKAECHGCSSNHIYYT